MAVDLVLLRLREVLIAAAPDPADDGFAAVQKEVARMIGLNTRVYAEATVRWAPRPVASRRRVRERIPGLARSGETVVLRRRHYAMQVTHGEVRGPPAAATSAVAAEATMVGPGGAIRRGFRRVRRRITAEQRFLKLARGVLFAQSALLGLAVLISFAAQPLAQVWAHA